MSYSQFHSSFLKDSKLSSKTLISGEEHIAGAFATSPRSTEQSSDVALFMFAASNFPSIFSFLRKDAFSKLCDNDTSKHIASLPISPFLHIHRYRLLTTFAQYTRPNMDPAYSLDHPHNRLKRKRVSLVVDGEAVLPTEAPVSPSPVISASQEDSENKVPSVDLDQSPDAPRVDPPAISASQNDSES
jgi:hypothetical protein